MTNDKPDPKIGAGHASAMARQGLAELRAALYSDSNVAQPPQYGLYGTKTPGEVQEDREASVREPEEPASSVFGGRMEAADQTGERDEREPREPEMD